VRPVADFINSPSLFSIVVAVLAGVVGVVSLTESRANALIGVFISVTTIPTLTAFNGWLRAHGRILAGIAAATAGVVLTVNGLTGLLR
jgi:uncharacterized membrane protein